MVYSDYDIGSSSRIDKNRIEEDVHNKRIRIATGGMTTEIVKYVTLFGSAAYFFRKFNQSSLPFRIGGAALLSYGLSKLTTDLSVVNFGNLQELVYLSNSDSESAIQQIHKVDIEKKIKEYEDIKENTIRKLNK